MPRATNAPASRRRRKRRLALAKGFRGARSKLFRQATVAVDRAGRLATTHRKFKKRDYRALWITRVNGALTGKGLRYSQFINGLLKAKITLNRKSLSEIAIADPAAFDAIVAKAKILGGKMQTDTVASLQKAGKDTAKLQTLNNWATKKVADRKVA